MHRNRITVFDESIEAQLGGDVYTERGEEADDMQSEDIDGDSEFLSPLLLCVAPGRSACACRRCRAAATRCCGPTSAPSACSRWCSDSISFLSAALIDAPFCDTNSTEVSGRYVVWTELMPMDSFIQCRACPVGATCAD